MNSNKHICDCALEVSKLIQLTTFLQKKIVNASDMTMSQATTILNIYSHKELSMGDLCKLDCIDCSTLTRNVEKLQKQGWVNKKISPSDKRICLISLTPKGEEKALSIKNTLSNKLLDTLSSFSEESCRQVSISISLLINALQNSEESCCEYKNKC